MKSGLFAIFQGKEYKITAKEDGTFTLLSCDSNDLTNGFTFYKGSVYIKNVMANELQSAYSVNTFAEYKGYQFQVLKIENERAYLSTGDFRAYQNLGLDMIDRGIYQKWVNSSEITRLFEDKKLLPGF